MARISVTISVLDEYGASIALEGTTRFTPRNLGDDSSGLVDEVDALAYDLARNVGQEIRNRAATLAAQREER